MRKYLIIMVCALAIDKAEQAGAKTVFNANPLDKNIKSRNLGPQ